MVHQQPAASGANANAGATTDSNGATAAVGAAAAIDELHGKALVSSTAKHGASMRRAPSLPSAHSNGHPGKETACSCLPACPCVPACTRVTSC